MLRRLIAQLVDVLPQVGNSETRATLDEMRDAHLRNIERRAALITSI